MQQQQEISAGGSKEVFAAASTTTTKQQPTMALTGCRCRLALWFYELESWVQSIMTRGSERLPVVPRQYLRRVYWALVRTLVRLLCHCVHIKLISAVSSKFADMTKLISVQFNSAISCNPPLCPGLGPGSSGKFEVVWYYPLSSLLSQPSYDDNNG